MPWRVRDAALLLLVGLGILVLSVAAVQGLYQLQGTIPPQAPATLALVATNLFYLLMLGGVWLLIIHRYCIPWSTLGLRRPRRVGLWPLLLLPGLLLLGTVAIMAAATWLLGIAGVRAELTPQSGLPPTTDPLFAVAVIGTLLVAPVVEEVLFRGVLYQALRKHSGPLLAATGSALLFTLLHLQLAPVPETILLGIVLAAAFEQTRSLYPSMVIHAIYNGIILLLALGVGK